MLHLFAVQLKVLLNAACNVDITCAFIWWEILCHSIFTNAISSKVIDRLKNLSKRDAIEITSVSCLSNLERLCFERCHHIQYLNRPSHDCAIFGWLYQNIYYFPAIIWLEKRTGQQNRSIWQLFDSVILKQLKGLRMYEDLLMTVFLKKNDPSSLIFCTTLTHSLSLIVPCPKN